MEVAWSFFLWSGSKSLSYFLTALNVLLNWLKKIIWVIGVRNWGMLLVTSVVANNSPSQAFNHPDDLWQSRYVTPPPYVLLNYLVEKSLLESWLYNYAYIIERHFPMSFFGSNIAVFSHKCNQARSKGGGSRNFQIWIKFRYKVGFCLLK